MLPCRALSLLRYCALRYGLFAAGWILAAVSAWAQGAGEMQEYQKKAEFINSFTRFVDWPARKFAQPDAPFVIGIYGTDNISGLLQESIQNRPIKGRQVVIKHLLIKEELRSCHVLFISRSERDRLGPILGEVRRENVLTMGECDNFCAAGGIVNFVTTGGQVHFQINNPVAARERLIISSKLEQLAVPWNQGINVVPVNNMKLGEPPR